MKYSGYIEGFYGKLLTWQQRQELVDSLAAYNLSHYLFAPKEDSYHRLSWRTLPDDTYTAALELFIQTSAKKDITVIPAIAPGLSYTHSRKDYEILLNRIDHFFECGATEAALLMDDIPAVPPSHTTCSLGTVHGELMRAITNNFPGKKIHFCPTIYTDELLDGTETATHYLADLAESLPEETLLFWTGTATIAPTLCKESLATVLKHFSHRIILWDNFYSNDYATGRLFVGPYENRCLNDLEESTCGCMINPTGLPLTDTLLLDIFSQWINQNPTPWQQTLLNHGVPENIFPFLVWCYTPFTTAALSKEIAPMDFFTECVVKWDSELKREWYPYLHRIFVELRMIEGTTTEKPHWFPMRFLPHTAHKLEE